LIGCGWYGKTDLFRLIQVAPVEVVSLCDVDKTMLAECADMVATRQLSKKKPRTYGDYREMLKEKDLVVVLIGTPDHWHALNMIAACEAGADVYCQKPISVDIVEGQAMLAAARKHGRVVQIGTQRRSTPHLIGSATALSAKQTRENWPRRNLLLLATCVRRQPPTRSPREPRLRMWTGPAPMLALLPVDASARLRALWNTATGSWATWHSYV
jgi:hypothetical protein